MKIPDLINVKKIIQEWASKNPRIVKVYLFGSYVTKRKYPPGDIDVAIEISNEENDTSSGFWCFEGKKMEADLEKLLEYKVDLEMADSNTPVVNKALNNGSLQVYPS